MADFDIQTRIGMAITLIDMSSNIPAPDRGELRELLKDCSKELRLLRRVSKASQSAIVDWLAKGGDYDARILAPELAELHKFDTERMGT